MGSGRKRSVGIDPELYEKAKAYSEDTGESMSDALVAVISGGIGELASRAEASELVKHNGYASREYLDERFDRLERNQRNLGTGIAAGLEGQQALGAGEDEAGVRRRQAEALFREAERQGLDRGGMKVLEETMGFQRREFPEPSDDDRKGRHGPR